MKVHLIRKQTIEEFVKSNARSKKSFEEWLSVLRLVNWEKPEDIKKTYGSADLLGKGSSRVVFDIGGNNYRMIVKYQFGENMVHLFICWIGTHAEYDKLMISKSSIRFLNINQEVMEKMLKYTVIKSKSQYKQYCNTLEELVFMDKKSKELKDEIELLTILIEHWDKQHNTMYSLDPVELLNYLMKEHKISQIEMSKILGVSKSVVSEILSYKKGMSKQIIRKLSTHFKLSQEAFNKEYMNKQEFVLA